MRKFRVELREDQMRDLRQWAEEAGMGVDHLIRELLDKAIETWKEMAEEGFSFKPKRKP